MSSLSEAESVGAKRELAAIMFSDIAGYTTLMGRDERRAVQALAEHRKLVQLLAARFNGRVTVPAVCGSEPDVAFLIRTASGRWIANGTVLR